MLTTKSGLLRNCTRSLTMKPISTNLLESIWKSTNLITDNSLEIYSMTRVPFFLSNDSATWQNNVHGSVAFAIPEYLSTLNNQHLSTRTKPLGDIESVCRYSSVLAKRPIFQCRTLRIGTTNIHLARTSNNGRSSTSRNLSVVVRCL